MSELLRRLELPAPAFPVDAGCVEVLTDQGPKAFFARLRQMIGTAKHQISIASLYLGTSDPERALIDDIDAALDTRPDLRVRIVLDYSRGQRKTPRGTSLTVLSELIATRPERLQAFVHHMPQLRGLAGWLPSPLDECVAVFHFKALVFDDTAILTGANLNDEYFDNKQARYIVVRDKHFAEMLHDVVDVTSEHSKGLQWQAGRIRFAPSRRDPALVMDAVLDRVVQGAPKLAAGDTALVPVFQHPGLGVRQESQLIQQMFAWPDGELVITTPYSNFPPEYVRAIAGRLTDGATHQTVVVGASGNSHSFTTGRGLKALVPGVYRHRERSFIEALRRAARSDTESKIDFRHYEREGWVFHSKGAWFSTDDECATVIGSSSFGQRSYTRDFDMSCLIQTSNPHLREALWREVTGTLEHARKEREVTRPAAWTAPLVAPFVKRYL